MTKPTDPTSRRGLSRRQILKASAGTAALLAAAKLNFPAGAFAQGAGPEVTSAKLGFIALTLYQQYNDSLTELRNNLKHFHLTSGENVKREEMRSRFSSSTTSCCCV